MDIPKSNSFTSDAARSPSRRNALSMFFDRSIASLSLDALTAQPILMCSYFYVICCLSFFFFSLFYFIRCVDFFSLKPVTLFTYLIFFWRFFSQFRFRLCFLFADIDSVLFDSFCFQFSLKHSRTLINYGTLNQEENATNYEYGSLSRCRCCRRRRCRFH